MTGITCALAGAVGNPYAGTSFVTVGFLSGGGFTSYGFNTGGQGTIYPANWSGTGIPIATLKDVYYTGVPQWLDFTILGDAPNSGWTTMDVNGTTLNRVDASYSNNPGSSTTWLWFGAPTPFGTTVGAGRLITWA